MKITYRQVSNVEIHTPRACGQCFDIKHSPEVKEVEIDLELPLYRRTIYYGDYRGLNVESEVWERYEEHRVVKITRRYPNNTSNVSGWVAYTVEVDNDEPWFCQEVIEAESGDDFYAAVTAGEFGKVNAEMCKFMRQHGL